MDGGFDAVAHVEQLIACPGHCDRVGLAHAWEAIVCANDTPTMDKSELYRQARSLLGVQADEAIAIDDSSPGVQAARAAGVCCIAVSNEVTRAAAFEADRAFASLADVSLAELVQSTETRSA